jgi:hypothetical protein
MSFACRLQRRFGLRSYLCAPGARQTRLGMSFACRLHAGVWAVVYLCAPAPQRLVRRPQVFQDRAAFAKAINSRPVKNARRAIPFPAVTARSSDSMWHQFCAPLRAPAARPKDLVIRFREISVRTWRTVRKPLPDRTRLR